jgi:hypothetical protein
MIKKLRLSTASYNFWFFFLIQVVDFVIVVINFRAVTHLHYTVAVITDGIICALGWTFLKKLKEEDGKEARAGFILGGMVGSLLGMYLTRVWG